VMTLHDLPDGDRRDFGFFDIAGAKAVARAMREAQRDGGVSSSVASIGSGRPSDAGFVSVGAARVAAIAPGEIPVERQRPALDGADLPADGGLASI